MFSSLPRLRSRRRSRFLTVAAVAVAASMVLAGCGDSSGPAAAGGPAGSADDQATTTSTAGSSSPQSAGALPGGLDPADPVKIRIADAANTNLLELAKGEGFFARYGLEPELSSLNSGVNVLAALQGGSIEFGYADFFAGINAIANGFDVRLISNNNGNGVNFNFLVKDGAVADVADLAGKKVGVAPVPQITVNARGFLKANGVDPDSVEIAVITDPNGAIPGLERGDYDALGGASWTQVYQNDGSDGYDFATIGDPSSKAWTQPDATTAAFWATGEYAEANPEVAAALTNALHSYRKWWNDLPTDDKVDLVKKYQDLDYRAIVGDDQEKLTNLVSSTAFQSGPIDLEATQTWYQLGLDYAPDKITAGVEWQSHVFDSARQPEPND
ncbi:ABC transporter substrate-binding protein [Nakamurella leprariae]|uniref:ABC transporter substrate-binding protein n=1 Tax=Nakamurella leprariae TaxID=2803911 RepID=A0A939C0U8_9ACTN|nr:ABC transporter substrate-binding protein [Nakamurella leprariae]MBM9469600.1 ABC transporter substrate-binding protein [Nakamurella leprariae]